ncbi:MAG: M20/M25/M40 family metallo-hydrolase [Alistipes sp.]|nr:M20/M25/M40 family metallo-hydrolase [Alistipes sp.]
MKPATNQALELLRRLIATPSHTRDEGATADLLCAFFEERGIAVERLHNNIIVRSKGYQAGRKTLLLNSHHDTVRPAASYTRNPYAPTLEEGVLYGLGANDAGASLVALIELFLAYYDRALPFNLQLLLSAEEECGGEHGIRACYDHLQDVEMAIVGEPTSMQAAIAEPGLVVLDCEAKGRSGHAARGEGVNALYIALDDIQQVRTFQFEHTSAILGPVRMTATMINCGTQHNVVPDSCRFVVDVRTTDAYTNEEVVELLRAALQSEVTPRSTRIHASVIDEQHPLVRAAVKAGAKPFISTTTSDRTLMPFSALKIGPGDSARSHTADEYVLVEEIEQGIATYVEIIENLAQLYGN